MIEESEKIRLEEKQMPDGYVVLNGKGIHMYSADQYDYCNDHINDCALYENVQSWVIRGFIFVGNPNRNNKKLKKTD